MALADRDSGSWGPEFKFTTDLSPVTRILGSSGHNDRPLVRKNVGRAGDWAFPAREIFFWTGLRRVAVVH